MPKVMSLGEALSAWLQHRKEVLVRRSQYRLDQIAHRLEVLGGYIIAFLNLDEVIRIIREEDDAKGELIARFDLTDVQGIIDLVCATIPQLKSLEQLRRI